MEQGRLFKIVYYLLDKGRATAPELAEKLEVSVRTIYRDLDVLSVAGIPIYTTQGKGGGIFLLPEFVLDKSLLSPQEKEQILMALQGLSVAENRQSDELLAKVGGLFRAQHADWIEVDFSDWHKNTAKADVFDQIKGAILSRHKIKFSYFSGEGDCTARTVEPYKLVFKSKDWYLYGFCCLRNDFRFFKLTRIKDLKILSETFLRKVADTPASKASIQNEPLIPVKLKFSPEAAFRVYDEFTDTVTKDAQENLYVAVNLPEKTLYSYILSFGDTVEILEPDALRHNMKEILVHMAGKYKT